LATVKISEVQYLCHWSPVYRKTVFYYLVLPSGRIAPLRPYQLSPMRKVF